MEILIDIWNTTPSCIKLPIAILIGWIIIAKIIVGITSSGTELTEEEATRGAGIILLPAILALFGLNKVERELNKTAKYFRYPGAKDDDDIDII